MLQNCKLKEFTPFLFGKGVFLLKEVNAMDKRLGVIGIVVEDLESVNQLNMILHEYSNLIVGRMGIPYRERGISVISLIVDGSNDDISALTGKIGRINNISVKSALTKTG
jgi:putative iron-only hydrogenase system regulator